MVKRMEIVKLFSIGSHGDYNESNDDDSVNGNRKCNNDLMKIPAMMINVNRNGKDDANEDNNATRVTSVYETKNNAKRE